MSMSVPSAATPSSPAQERRSVLKRIAVSLPAMFERKTGSPFFTVRKREPGEKEGLTKRSGESLRRNMRRERRVTSEKEMFAARAEPHIGILKAPRKRGSSPTIRSDMRMLRNML